MSKTAEALSHLRWLADHLDGLQQEVEIIETHIQRLQTDRDNIHAGIVREAKKEATAEAEAMLSKARAETVAIRQEAQERAGQMIRDAWAAAAQAVAEGEDKLRAMDENVIVEKAKELLTRKAA
jgi:hypothetical protein